jgi:hypothetical protein
VEKCHVLGDGNIVVDASAEACLLSDSFEGSHSPFIYTEEECIVFGLAAIASPFGWAWSGWHCHHLFHGYDGYIWHCTTYLAGVPCISFRIFSKPLFGHLGLLDFVEN